MRLSKLLLLVLLGIMFVSLTAFCREDAESRLVKKWLKMAECAQSRCKKMAKVKKPFTERDRYVYLLQQAYAAHADPEKIPDVCVKGKKTICYKIIIDTRRMNGDGEDKIVVEYFYDRRTGKLLHSRLAKAPLDWLVMSSKGRDVVNICDDIGNQFSINLKDPFSSKVFAKR